MLSVTNCYMKLIILFNFKIQMCVYICGHHAIMVMVTHWTENVLFADMYALLTLYTFCNKY